MLLAFFFYQMNLNRSAIHHLHPLDSLPEGGLVAFIEVPSWHFLQFLPSSSSQARIKSSMSWSILFIIIYVYYQQISDGTYKLMCVCAVELQAPEMSRSVTLNLVI